MKRLSIEELKNIVTTGHCSVFNQKKFIAVYETIFNSNDPKLLEDYDKLKEDLVDTLQLLRGHRVGFDTFAGLEKGMSRRRVEESLIWSRMEANPQKLDKVQDITESISRALLCCEITGKAPREDLELWRADSCGFHIMTCNKETSEELLEMLRVITYNEVSRTGFITVRRHMEDKIKTGKYTNKNLLKLLDTITDESLSEFIEKDTPFRTVRDILTHKALGLPDTDFKDFTLFRKRDGLFLEYPNADFKVLNNISTFKEFDIYERSLIYDVDISKELINKDENIEEVLEKAVEDKYK